jgi:ATP-dependent DNA helicase RecG
MPASSAEETMTEAEILERIGQGEGPACAFLPARFRLQALGETLVALANSDGGLALLGVRAGRRSPVEGLLAPEEVRALVTEVAQECVPPLALPAPEVVTVQGRSVVVVTVPAGLPQAYHYHGLYVRRVGSQNVLPSSTELRSLLLERSEERFESLVPAGATLDDLDMARVKAYAAELQAVPVDPLQLLWQRGCAVLTPEGPRPTNAGLLLFGRTPQVYLPQAQIVLAHYAGTAASANPTRQEVGGPLPEQIHQAESFLQSHMRRGRMLVDSQRVEVTEYPMEAIREAIVNAVAHRDYSPRGEEIRVEMFQDRIEVYSPGWLPGPVSLERRGDRFARNPVIARVLSDLGFGTRLGRGLQRMAALMAEAHLPRPDLHRLRAGFLLTLQGPSGMPVGELPADPQALARLGLNERQVQALLYVSEKGRLSGRDLQDLCPQVTIDTLRRDLSELVARGLLLKVGERRATYYILR